MGHESLNTHFRNGCADFAEYAKMEKYFVIEYRNIGFRGHPVFEEKVLFSGPLMDCVIFEDNQRRKYKDRIIADCFVVSEEDFLKFYAPKFLSENLTNKEPK